MTSRHTVSFIAISAITALAAWPSAGARAETRQAAQPAQPGAVKTLEAELRSILATYRRPGAALSVVRDGVVVARVFAGEANIETHEPVTASTVFTAASLSKPVLGTAVLMVAEELSKKRGITLDAILDTDLDHFLEEGPEGALGLRHPDAPSVPITLRMLLSHVSGIKDHYGRTPHDVPVTPPDFRHDHLLTLRSAHIAYLHPDGLYFDKENFVPGGPLKRAVYSSVASSIAAHFVAAESGMAFDEYCRRRIFEPLGMHSTAWRFSDLPRSATQHVAYPTQVKGGKIVPITPPLWEQTFYPSASLKSTVDDYTRFLIALSGGGVGVKRLLSPASLKEMTRIQFPALAPARGLIVAWVTRGGVKGVGHSGQNAGFRSEMFFQPPDGDAASHFGVVVLTNGESEIEGVAMDAAVVDHAMRWALTLP